MILTIIGICLLIVSLILFIFTRPRLDTLRIKKEQAHKIQLQVRQQSERLKNLTKDCHTLTEQIIKERQNLKFEQEQFKRQRQNWKELLDHQEEQIRDAAAETRREQTEKTEQLIRELTEKRESALQDLYKLKSALEAGAAAQLREREKEENKKFYKMNLPTSTIEDIDFLNSIKYRLHDPTILSKLIWSQYYQQEFKLLCNRLFTQSKICGIYKITNTKTEEAYIGQSVDVIKRWTDHVKCGLGINASATNRLYSAMQEYGVHNFTFELLEECPKEQLNEKEAFWIAMYNTNNLGYNITKGNK